MRHLVLLAWIVLPVDPGAAASPLIHRIEVQGNLRMSAESILHVMHSRPGEPLDRGVIAGDIRRLHATRLFQNIEIHALLSPAGGMDLVVRLRERPFISRLLVDGVDEGSETRIKELLCLQGIEFRPATPYDPAAGARAARVVRSWMAARGHPAAEVGVECRGEGTLVAVWLTIRSGPRLGVAEISFTGNCSISSDELRSLMHQTRTSSWFAGWSRGGYYSPERLDADIDCIRRRYRSLGYARVTVAKPIVTVQPLRHPALSPLSVIGRRLALHISIPVIEGDVFSLGSVDVEGDARAATTEVTSIAGDLRRTTRYNADTLEVARKRMLEALGLAGYPYARVALEESLDEQERTVRARFKVEAENAALLGRIDFQGNQRVPDRLLRRELRVAEGQVFDSSKVDESIKRLNRSGLTEELGREEVSLLEDPETGTANLTFRVKEKPPQGIYGTGGTFGADGGYLGVFYTAFNLLGLGEKLSLRLDGGVASSNLLLNLAGQHFLGSPFTIGLSVFHRYSGVNVASIVPDASDLVRLLTDRRKGIRLAGSYSIGTRAQTGIGLQLERATTGFGDGNRSTPRLTSEFSAGLDYDSADTTGSSVRGYRFSSTAGVSSRALMGAIESASGSAHLTRYLADPWTGGRNSFAVKLNLGAVLTAGAGGIPPEKRLYPGGEILRGFRRGEPGSWAVVQDDETYSLRAIGADTFIAASAEYRVPITGPLSGAAFFDLGWSRSDPKAVRDPGLRLVDATNALVRASTGGELRLELPVINQPARLIFAWNPLRLNRILHEGTSIQSIADRRGLVRFALGGIN